MATYSSTPSLETTSPVSSTNMRRGISLWAVSLILVVVGMLIAGYLSYTKLTSTSMICVENTAIFDCHAVETSRWASFMGIPVAYLGFGAHFLLGVILLLERRFGFFRENGVMLMFAIALFCFCYHCYLTYNAIFSIGKLCPWCLAAHATMTLQLIVTGLRLRQHWRQMSAYATETV